jgi:RNA polymerase sigma-70 factor (ECF subfamily)
METYLKAWKAMPRFKGRSSLKTWTYRIVHNCALDFIRSRKRIREIPLAKSGADGSVEMDISDPGQLMPDEAAAISDDAKRVQAALTFLSPEHRNTLLLRFSDGLTYSEIAAATGVSTGTVMSRLFNAKRKLRKVIESDEDRTTDR